jgi:hypothetical protein
MTGDAGTIASQPLKRLIAAAMLNLSSVVVLHACRAPSAAVPVAVPVRSTLDASAPRAMSIEVRDPGTAVRLEHATDRNAWRLTYTLARPMRKVRFVRGSYANRGTHWRLTTAGLSLTREDGIDVIAPQDGRPFREFAIDIASYAIHPEKDYQLFVPYSDGSTLVYTGHFDVRDAGGEGDSKSKTTFTFVPRKNERVVVRGELSRGDGKCESEGDGTYVYFGSTEPVVGDAFIGVIDAGMPSWLRAPMEKLLPIIFRLYAERTGVPLPFRPTVFLSYGDEPSARGLSFGGGTLAQVVQMEILLGSERRTAEDEQVREEAGYLVAHEAAHLWNGQMFHHETPGGDWMHEGGADAFAYEALRTVGAITDARLREIQGEALSKCLVGTRLGPVHGSSVPGRYKLYYWCGHLAAHLTTKLGVRANPPRDIFTFWGELMRAAPNRVYDEDGYWRLLRGLPDGAGAESALRGLLAGVDAEPVTALLRADSALTQTPTSSARSATYERFSGLVVATLLLRKACGRDVSPEAEPGGFQVLGACGALGKDPVLAEVAGHELRGKGAAAYDAAVSACANRATVTAAIRRDATATSPLVATVLACPRPFLPRPPHVTPR